MKKVKFYKVLIILIVFSLLGLSIYTYKNFAIAENYTSLELNFNPSGSISTYESNGTSITISGGFVKGKVIDNKQEFLVLRSLSPDFKVSLKGNSKSDGTYHLRIENISPEESNISNIDKSQIKTTDAHTVSVTIDLKANEEKTVTVSPKESKEGFEFVMLGDNRDGYETFSQILDQINNISPVFTVDDGDLVFGGEPHKYRLFYQSVAKLKVPLYTTIGNHDIRENGRVTYTKLFGPPYYSFDYKNAHFVFLDSSRGFTEKTAIPEAQYKWLEDDLRNSRGKRIFVFSHIPPVDPRESAEKNSLTDIDEEEKPGLIERILNNYSAYKSMNHGFPDKTEAKRFEDIMAKYHVDTVFLSHIHSYLSYVKDDVRYIISGGGGAELLTKYSYYHYLRVKVTDKDTYLEAIEMPSPVNTLQDRYIAAFNLFAYAIYIEYKTVVIIVSILISLMFGMLLWSTRNKWGLWVKFWGKFLIQIFRAGKDIYKKLKKNQ